MKQSLQVIENYRFSARGLRRRRSGAGFRQHRVGARRIGAAGPARQLRAPARLGGAREPVARQAPARPRPPRAVGSGGAARALERAKRLREGLFAIVSSLAAGRSPPGRRSISCAQHWLAGATAQEFQFDGGRFSLGVAAEDDDLDLISAIIAWRTVERGVAVARRPPAHLPGPGLRLDSSSTARRRAAAAGVTWRSAATPRSRGATTRSHAPADAGLIRCQPTA